MKKIVHYIGLDVHKETIAVAIAAENTSEVRHYGIIGGTLDAIDKLIKKLGSENVGLRFVYEAGPCGYVLYRHLKNKGIVCAVVAPSLVPPATEWIANGLTAVCFWTVSRHVAPKLLRRRTFDRGTGKSLAVAPSRHDFG